VVQASAASNLIVPPEWEALAAEDVRGAVLLVGGTDSGKTSLATYLVQQWSARGRTIALMDCDVGQGVLGLPATMALRVLTGSAYTDHCFFVGAISPRGHMLRILMGVHTLYRKALALGAETVIVDSTGLVDPGQGGLALKQAKIDLLMPCRVIALARGAELNPILASWRNHPLVQITTLRVSPHARTRSRAERVAWRRERWEAYFRQAVPLTFPLQSIATINWLLPTAQRICAFLDAEGLCRGIGRVTYVARGSTTITTETPLRSLEGVVAIRFGAPRLEERILGNATPQ